MTEPALPIAAGAARPEAAPLRFITAASLFDGHDAAINIMRRLIQAHGAEVVHLGHNRSVDEIVRAAIDEDADAIAVSSYQGGHMEFFKYMIDRLRQLEAAHIRVFGGGGGTITPEEIAELEAYGVTRLYHPHHGMQLGLKAMISDVIGRAGELRGAPAADLVPSRRDRQAIARQISVLESGAIPPGRLEKYRKEWQAAAGRVPVVGITGTGGAGKSSVTDELLNRFLRHFPDFSIAVVAVDPTRRKTGGALLGDRIRMNSLRSERIYMRSLATRRRHLATSAILGDVIALLKASGFDLVIVETAGIGQGDTEVADLVDFPLYVMTVDYGAASQLEKIDMLDFARIVVLNKYDRKGSEDALRDIRKQWKRNHQAFDLPNEAIPVYPTIASQFNDPGIWRLFGELCRRLAADLDLDPERWTVPAVIPEAAVEPRQMALIPGARVRYLAEIAEQGRDIARHCEMQAELAERAWNAYRSLAALADPHLPEPLALYTAPALETGEDNGALPALRRLYQESLQALDDESLALLRAWPARREAVRSEHYRYEVRGKTVEGDNFKTSLAGLQIPKIAVPKTANWGDQLRFLQRENLPGAYPYTAGVYPYRRSSEDPTRMFAGEGMPERTNRRFHYLSAGQPAARLSTAFDSVTLYGEDPAERPDIYGKIGNSGVSIATLDDMKRLYSGFDLSAPNTSVSMTINGPAPMILAMFMNTAIDQQVEKHLRATGRWAAAEKRLAELAGGDRPLYRGALPDGNDGLGLGLLGASGEDLIAPGLLAADEYERLKADTVSTVRGTVQADILKEDQAQNTCIFSTEFALRMMGDIQQWFIDHRVRNFYSVSISGYHIAEAGANPITQLAFTLANGLTIVEYYLARGMAIDDFAPNLSFFFSNGMDPEYTVIGRVARRIWARAMRHRYGANRRSQMLKYHIQTSGRSLHAQEIQFNDIRTTLQALYAIFDNCNSLHTNAYDEAITTPTEESVRRAMAIQLIINRELGLNYNENPWQGSYVVEELTDLVEEAVYREFERLSERGGVLGAMDTMYQRGKIQDESMLYEQRKHDGSLPLIGVNTFLPRAGQAEASPVVELIRATEEEKQAQIADLRQFQQRHAGRTGAALEALQRTAARRENTFAALMDAVRYASLGQLSNALYAVGGEYRRNM